MAIEIQIFIGFRQNGEIKAHLKRSSRWTDAKMINQALLKETSKDAAEYIGCYMPSQVFYDQLKEKELELKRQLQIYCPKLNLDKHPIYLFSQIFII